MVSKHTIIEVSISLGNILVYMMYTVSVITWITGVDITKIFVMPPIEFEKILQAYPEVFYALVIGQLAILTVDQVLVGTVFKKRVMPPPKYIFASSLAVFTTSTVLFLFLRTTPLWPYYIFFMAISLLALIHSSAILTKTMKEIPIVEEAKPQTLFFTDSLLEASASSPKDIYRESYVDRIGRRRALRECQL